MGDWGAPRVRMQPRLGCMGDLGRTRGLDASRVGVHGWVWVPRGGGAVPAVRRQGAPQAWLWPHGLSGGPVPSGGDPLMCPLCPAVPNPESAGRCLKLRVSVCCRGTSESGCTPKLQRPACSPLGLLVCTGAPGGAPCPPGEPLTDTTGFVSALEPVTEVPNSQPHGRGGPEGEYGARTGGWGGLALACPDLCSRPGRRGARPGGDSRTAAPCAMPGAAPPHPAPDLTPALPAARGRAPAPGSRLFFHRRPSPSPRGSPGARLTRRTHRVEPGPGAPGWKVSGEHGGSGCPLSRCPLTGLSTSLPGTSRWHRRTPAGACAAPGPSPHLVPSPMDPTPGDRGPPGPGAGRQLPRAPPRCLVLRRGHMDLSSGKTRPPPRRHRPLRFGFNPW